MTAIVPNPALSVQYAIFAPGGGGPVKSSDWGSKLRCSYASVVYAGTTGTAGTIKLLRLPQGKIRILGWLSRILGVHASASLRVDVGYTAHTNADGTAVVADVNGIASAQDPDTFAAPDELASTHLELDSREGIDITYAIQAGALAAGDTFKIWLVYMQGN
jgi:hypothetical protein